MKYLKAFHFCGKTLVRLQMKNAMRVWNGWKKTDKSKNRFLKFSKFEFGRKHYDEKVHRIRLYSRPSTSLLND